MSFVDDHDLPCPHHPVLYDGTDANGYPIVSVDRDTTVTACQLRPGTWDVLADWCGGEKTFDTGQAVILRDDAGTAQLGDWVLSDGQRFRIEAPGGFSQRWWPQGRDF